MFTLKIRWYRHVTDSKGVGGVADETTLFIPADEVRVHGTIVDPEREMASWEDGTYLNYLHDQETQNGTWVQTSYSTGSGNHAELSEATVSTRTTAAGRLIEVIRGNETTWYLASQAWLLGPAGNTIERVAP